MGVCRVYCKIKCKVNYYYRTMNTGGYVKDMIKMTTTTVWEGNSEYQSYDEEVVIMEHEVESKKF